MGAFLENRFLATGISRRTILRQLVGFTALTCLITFGLACLYFFTDIGADPAVANALLYVAVFAPTVASVVMSYAEAGRAGVARLFGMLVRPTNYLRWSGVALLLLPGSWLMWALLERITGAGQTVDLHALFVTMPLLLFTTGYVLFDPGPIGEELGLRGYALPRLLALYPPGVASLLMGVAHALWHLPVFFVAGSFQSSLNVAMFFGWTIALSYLWTWLFLWANGNVLVSGVLIHLLFNIQGAAGVFPNLENIGVVTCVVALILVTCFPFTSFCWETRRDETIYTQLERGFGCAEEGLATTRKGFRPE